MTLFVSFSCDAISIKLGTGVNPMKKGGSQDVSISTISNYWDMLDKMLSAV